MVLVPNVLSGGTGFQYATVTGMKNIGPDNKFNTSAIKLRRGCTLEIHQDGTEAPILMTVPLAVLVPEKEGEDFKLELENGRPREWLGRCIGVVVNLNGSLTLCYGQIEKVRIDGDGTPIFQVSFRSVKGHRAPPHEFTLEAIEDNEVRPLQMYLGLGQGPARDERGAIAQMMSLGSELQDITSAEGFTPPEWLMHFPDADIMGPQEQILNTALVPDRMARVLKKQGWIKVDPASLVKPSNTGSIRTESPGGERPVARTLFEPRKEEAKTWVEPKLANMGNTGTMNMETERERMFEEFCRLMERKGKNQNNGAERPGKSIMESEGLTAEQQVVRSKKSFIPTTDQLERHTLIVDGRNYGKCTHPVQATGVIERIFEDLQTILRSREAAQVVAVTWFDGRVHHAPMSAFKNNKSFELKFDQTWEQVIWSKNPKLEKDDLDDLSVFWECFHTLSMVSAKAYVAEYGVLLEVVRQQLNVAIHHLGGLTAFTRLRRSSRIKVLQLAALFLRGVMDTFVRSLQVSRDLAEALKQGRGASEGMQHFQNGLVSSIQAIQIEDLQHAKGTPTLPWRNQRGDGTTGEGNQPRLPDELKKVVPTEGGKRLCLKFFTKEGCKRSKCHFAHANGKIDLPEELHKWMIANYGPMKE